MTYAEIKAKGGLWLNANPGGPLFQAVFHNPAYGFTGRNGADIPDTEQYGESCGAATLPYLLRNIAERMENDTNLPADYAVSVFNIGIDCREPIFAYETTNDDVLDGSDEDEAHNEAVHGENGAVQWLIGPLLTGP